MMIPIIKVTDKDTNTTHIVGTDSHDCLIIENNALHYYNLQCGCGGETFKFVGEQNELFGATVEMVTFEEFVKLYNEETKKREEIENRFKKLVEELVDDLAISFSSCGEKKEDEKKSKGFEYGD